MRRTIVMRLLLVLMIVGLTFPTFAFGQGPDEATQLRALIHQNDVQIARWERIATTSIVLTIVVGALGILASALQKSQSNWCRATTVAVGLCIGIITLILNTAFPSDYRQFRRLAIEGRELISDLDLMVSDGIPADGENHRAWLDAFQKKLHQLLELGKESYPTTARLSVLPTVYAQSAGKKPAWVSKLPEEPSNLYFLGIGDDPSLETARGISRDNAIHRAAEYFSQHFQNAQKADQRSFDSAALSQYVVKSAQEASTYFEYNVSSRSYRYYILLRLPKDIAAADLKLYSLQEKLAVPRELDTVVQAAPDLAKTYSAIPFPYLLGQYKIAQNHFKLLDLATAKLGVYIGDIQPAKVAQVLVFKPDHLGNLSERQKTDYLRLKDRLRPEDALFDKAVSDQERVRITLEGRELSLELQYSASGESFATVTVKSSTK